jgi:citrate lyase subunit beta / citryl-CoA lyase
MPPLPVLRSFLFVPGIRPDFLPKAMEGGADALVFDLEDSVPPGAKDVARTHVSAWLAGMTDRLTLIRFNHPSAGDLDKDLAVLAPHGSQAIMLPKVEAAEDLRELDGRLSSLESAHGLAPQAIGIVVVIESSIGLRHLFDILRSTSRVRGAGLASAEQGDFLADIGGQWTPTGEALSYARGKFVCDARAARASWLIDGAFMNLRDERALEAESRIARIHGFNGKVAINPRQVPTINRVFSPTVEEIERARGLLEAFREAEAVGRGAAQFREMMIDYANVRWAEGILKLAGIT